MSKVLGFLQQAMSHHQAGRLPAAIGAYRRALKISPDSVDVWYNLGLALFANSQDGEAAQAFRQTVTLNPKFAEGHYNLGHVLKRLRQDQLAMECYRRAAELRPDVAEIQHNLGSALRDLGLNEDAVKAYRRATELQPDLIYSWQNLGVALTLLREKDEAAHAFAKVAEIDDQAPLLLQAVEAWRAICAWSECAQLESAVLQAIRQGKRQNAPISSFQLLAIDSASPEDQLTYARLLAAHYESSELMPTRKRDGCQPERIRLGYVSNDFHGHATAYLLTEIIERHDRSRFEVIAYDHSPNKEGDYRSRLENAFDRTVSIEGLTDKAAAERIAADGIDIVIDLKGWTGGTRSPILAWRPAEVQVQWLGYPGTMGASWIDYILADPYLIRPGEERFYQEKVVRLPDTYQPNDRQRPISKAHGRVAVGLPEKGFVFCCFNQAYKITPEVFAAWMALLKAVPGSVLWLLDDNRWATEALKRHADHHGVGSDRLLFAPRVPLDEHLGRLALADLALDCFPCGSHTTASDALWVGVPLVALSGETLASRVSGSLLTAIGLSSLIATNLDDYRSLCVRLATDEKALNGFRHQLSVNRLASPLFDSARFACHLERAYEMMWERCTSNLPPEQFDVPECDA